MKTNFRVSVGQRDVMTSSFVFYHKIVCVVNRKGLNDKGLIALAVCVRVSFPLSVSLIAGWCQGSCGCDGILDGKELGKDRC